MRALLLTEGGKEKGFGHITRCVALAQALQLRERACEARFFVNADPSVKNLLDDFHSCEYCDWLLDTEKIFAEISRNDVVILDSYYADETFCRELSDRAGLTVYWDDYNRIEYPEGIIINGAIGAEKLPYKRREGQTYLLGVDFSCPRKEFWNVPEKVIRKDIEQVLITVGGNDRRNLLPDLLKLLKKYRWRKKVFVTDAMSNVNEIKKELDTKTDLLFNPGPQTIKEVMLDSDIGITAAGQTIFEAARCGLPCITIEIVENQSNNVKFFLEHDLIKHAGSFSHKNLFENIEKQIVMLEGYDVRKKIGEKIQKFIDGKGAARLSHTIMECYGKR
ncbi:MAG: PseG/SpsG family protein [bacterium]